MAVAAIGPDALNSPVVDSTPVRLVRRGGELLLVAIAMPFAVILGMVVCLVVALHFGRPVIFRQVRAGRGGRPFEILKFRTMSNETGPDGELLPDEIRLTGIGRALRRFRVDELPALANVVAGQLAWVGPRPLPLKIILADPLGHCRLAVAPGFTGLAQVSGNTALTDHEKFAIDAYYIANRSLLGDVLIMFRTVFTIVLGERRNEQVIARALALAAKSVEGATG